VVEVLLQLLTCDLCESDEVAQGPDLQRVRPQDAAQAGSRIEVRFLRQVGAQVTGVLEPEVDVGVQERVGCQVALGRFRGTGRYEDLGGTDSRHLGRTGELFAPLDQRQRYGVELEILVNRWTWALRVTSSPAARSQNTRNSVSIGADPKDRVTGGPSSRSQT